MAPLKLLFKFPTRGRPLWFVKTLDLYMKMLSGKHYCEFMIAMDFDDETMCNDLMADYLCQIEPPRDSMTTLSWYWKDHTGKVDAVNSCISFRDFDIVTVISDDIEPTEQGYDDIIATCMTETFPDLDGIIYFDDSRCGAKVVTIPVIGKPMYRRLGNIVDPAFMAWGDNFSTRKFNAMGKIKYFDRVLLKHQWRKYGLDETYERAAVYRKRDRATYKQLWAQEIGEQT